MTMEERVKATSPMVQEQNVNPWSVSGEVGLDGKVEPINYDQLVNQFGTKIIDDTLLERFERVTGHKPHRFLRRQIVFSHRDLEVILDRHEKNEPLFIYTGRGPSSDTMHIGHMVPFVLTKWLSDVFEVPLVVMLTDDEKYLIRKGGREVEEYEHYSRENAKDIIALGFDPDRTFIFSDYAFMGGDFYRNITRIAKRINRGTVDSCFGFDSSTNIGKVASSFASSFPLIFGPDRLQTSRIPCLIPCAIDQDPYFRLTRDVASQLKYAKPSLIHARFLDALQGPGSKMSASVKSSSIFLNDNPKQILKKINEYAFSGGQETLEEHRAKGGDPEVDVSYQYLKFFLEDDEELERVRKDYKSGKLSTGEIKQKYITFMKSKYQQHALILTHTRCAGEVSKFCLSFQERRSQVTDEMLDRFMTPRPLLYKAVLSNTLLPEPTDFNSPGSVKDPNSRSQAKKKEKLRLAQEKKAEKIREKEMKAKVPGDTSAAGGDTTESADLGMVPTQKLSP
ncbi:unnamed protein product [Penicillium salamii]|uniref:Tryptophan--tRNA ligase, cytoplasmic n=1 Tax=Penicillium salamii TaxID=1612424 RepID=A0A9W4JK20_9EURO|nr:unnamed protein product [Penicillium salamii]CAG8150232.1 unnamed protein product [Penicillium salamii]CAG8176272.1 unnamed protein product [Penicillium salamii]CAG8198785.1 unnamed protein product [Penicillium salamii]CAG8282543.1 unnamed protein product [Penicillium salamii]